MDNPYRGKCSEEGCRKESDSLKAITIKEGGLGIPFMFCPDCYPNVKEREDNKEPFNLIRYLEEQAKSRAREELSDDY